MAVKMYERKLNEWWREPGEKLEEATGYSGLKAGSDGKNVPSVTTKYSKKSTSEDFGSEGVNVMEKKLQKGRVQEAEDFEDEDFAEDEEFDFDDEGGEDFNPEEEIPGEIEDEGLMPDIQITIDGKPYKLVPADEATMPGEDMDVGMDDIEAEAGDVEDGLADESFEDDDNFKEAVKAAFKKKLEEKKAGKKPVAEKKPVLKKPVTEKFTGEIVDSGNTSDFGHHLDTSFAKEGEAKTGKQYTPSKSDSVYEARRAKIKAWLEKKRAERKAIKEETSEIEKEDTPDKTIGDDFANVATNVGADPQLVERLKKIRARRAARQREAVEGVQIPDENLKKDLEASMEESFSFKDLMSGKYGSMKE